MKIYTKTGDKGETGLLGGKRVPKDDERIEAYGTIDELNSVIGVVLNYINNKEVLDLLEVIQNNLFVIGSDLASPQEKEGIRSRISLVKQEEINKLEKAIDYFDSKLDALKNFILPGGAKGASMFHLARTVCRRAERRVITLKNNADINENIIVYLNRLSDLLFVLSRYDNKINDIPDIIWKQGL